MATRRSSGLRTLLVGIDGACLDVVDGILDEGDVPALRSVFERGIVGPLESQIPPWTASAWPSIYTGVNPGKHGVFDFLTFDGYDWSLVDRTDVREHALWELLDRNGLSSVLVNVPVTHPPRAFDGALVPGYVSRDPPDTHPEGILDDVNEAMSEYAVGAGGESADGAGSKYPDGADGEGAAGDVGEYRIYGDHRSDPSAGEWIEEHRDLVEMRGAAFRYLLDRFDPDFGFVQFQATDTVFHDLPGDEDAVRAVYRAVDDELERTLEDYSPETVIVVSDHGIGEYEGYGFRVNEFLRNHGYVEAVRGGEGMPSWSSIARERSRGDGSGGTRVRTVARLAALAARAGMTSQRAESLLERVGLDGFVARHVPTDAIRAGTEQVDFPRSTAYMRSRLELGVRINLQGREPDGVVPPEEYDGVREDLVDLLGGARTPDGDPVFESVLPREEVFEGPYVDEAPDVVVVPAGYDHLPTAALLGEEFGPPREPWEHKPVGLFAGVGEAVDPSASLDGADVFDVAPTVLATLGVPASERMDGRALDVVEPAGRRSYPAFVPRRTSESDDQSVQRRLADLGYLE